MLMQEKDYNHITVTDIVTRADYNRATFYLHYKYKEELVKEIMEEMINGLAEGFHRFFKHLSLIHPASISGADIYLFNFILENVDFFKLWTDTNTIPNFYEKFVQTIEQILKEELTNVEKEEIAVNSQLLIVFQVYGIIGLIVEWIKSDFQASPHYMAQQLITLLNYYS